MGGFGNLFERLKKLILKAYPQENAFGLLIAERFPPKSYQGRPLLDFLALPAKDSSYEIRVHIFLREAVGAFGDEGFSLLKIAQIVQEDKQENVEASTLVKDIEKEIAIYNAKPQPFTSYLKFFVSSPTRLAPDLRERLRQPAYRGHTIPADMHLEETEGSRLAAVLALEAQPDVKYLRWLSERVTVESAFVAYMAARALAANALNLDAQYLERLRAAVIGAAHRLDTVVEIDSEARFDASARKQQLQAAEALVDMRSRAASGLRGDALDVFLQSILTEFNRETFVLLCRKMVVDLARVVNLDEPFDLIVVDVIVLAQANRWLFKLASAIHAERPTVEAFEMAVRTLEPPQERAP